MIWGIWRVDPGGSREPVAFVDDPVDAGQIIDTDRDKIDWEARYEVLPDGQENSEQKE